MRGIWRWAAIAALLAAFSPIASPPPAAAIDPPKCSDLLPAAPEGLHLPGELASANCIERDRFTAGGRQFLLADVAGYDPPDEAMRLSATREAVERAVARYSRWFSVPDTLLIFGSFPSLDRLSSGGSVLAIAVGDAHSCIIIVEKSALHTGRDGADRLDLMRTVAHELFHCVQRTDDRLDNRYLPWRDEGTAEYFGSLAIPEAEFNLVYGGDLPRLTESTLYELDESAAPFIYYLGRERSPDAVVNFLREASREDSDAGDVATLRNIAGVDRLFHDFVLTWLDGHLSDVDGEEVVFPIPSFRDAPLVDRAQTLNLGAAAPFMATARRYMLERGMAWEIEAPGDADALGSWRFADGAEWSSLPTIIDTCDRQRDGVVVITSAAASSEEREQTVEVSERPERRMCTCPLGTWSMGTDALRATPLSRMMPGALVSGMVSITFEADGRAVARYDEVTFDSAIDSTSSMRSVLTGSVSWRWRRTAWDQRLAGGPAPSGADVTDAMMIERTVENVDAAWRVEFWARGSRLNERRTPFRQSAAPGSVSMHPAICTPAGLRIAQNAVTPMNAGPPWTGMFSRATP